VEVSELVELLAVPGRRQQAIHALVGAVTATEMRTARPSAAAVDALVAGLAHPNPQVRWWCVQLLDHLPNPAGLAAIAGLLHDPVPRVRRNAAHALGCVACKPSWDGVLANETIARLAELAESDPNAKVRGEAARALSCTSR
jgi:HEAT repeat protein